MTKEIFDRSKLPNLLSPKGWYYFGQLLINSTYLQPFKPNSLSPTSSLNSEKKNTRNGYIEREIHGAMHASRVAWYTVMLHNLFLKRYQQNVEKKIQALTTHFNLSEEELFCLIRYVALGHDAAREGEGRDEWDYQSGQYIASFLKQHGLDPQLAEIFSKLASLKDKPGQLKSYLAAQNLSPSVIDGLQYARLLVCLADCFDIIRCHSAFKFESIKEKIATVFRNPKDEDLDVFFDFAKRVLQQLDRQKDLYFSTKLIEVTNKLEYKLKEYKLKGGQGEEYSVQEKVKLEHADCVLAAMLDSLKQDESFRELLKTDTPEYSLYDKDPAFNPYIHGTNSATLALMTKTDFQLMSVREIQNYGLIPLCGAQADVDQKPSFARLSGKENEYSLNKIKACYVTVQTVSKQECLDRLRNYTSSNIDTINKYLKFAWELGITLQEIPEIESDDFKQFYKTNAQNSATQNLLTKLQQPMLSPEDQELIKNPLPIILCYDQSRYMRIFSIGSQEYCAQKPLTLGKDIQIIATDTEANIQRLKAYSERHNLNLNIISFTDLENARDSLSKENPLSRKQLLEQAHSRGVKEIQLKSADIEAISVFCTRHQGRLRKYSKAVQSLEVFKNNASKIISSNFNADEKRRCLKNLAHNEFEHRHYLPRLLADALMLISSLALVGFAVGIIRVATGRSFFFSTEKTKRESEFINMVDTMALQ